LDNIDKYKAKALVNERRARLDRRQKVDTYLAIHPCVDCGESSIELLDFDHRDPAEKRATVNRLTTVAGWRTVRAEIEKCDVRCANCHRQRTARQFDWAKTKPLPKPGPMPVRVLADRMDHNANFLRECCWCYELKPLSEFAFRNISQRALSSHCRACHAAYRHTHYLRNRDRYFSQARSQRQRRRSDNLMRIRDHLLNHPCVDCGETDVASLDFDHVDPETKAVTISWLLARRAWASVQREMAKCVVRCAKCHRMRTLNQHARGESPGLQSAAPRE
jgi:hypothetical protein